MTPQEYLEMCSIDENQVKRYKAMSKNEREIWRKGYLQAVTDACDSSDEDYSDASDYLNALDYLVTKDE